MGACQSKTSTDLGQLSKLKEDVRLDQERRRSSVNGGVMPLNVTTGEKVAPATPGEIQPETPATVGGLPELPDLPPEAAPAGEMPELCVETDTAALLPGEEPNMLQKALSPLYSLVSPVAKLLSPKPPSPIKPDPAKNGLLHESGCPWCGTKVYIAERVLCLGREWHKTCLKCISCTKTLQLGQQLDHAKKPYCKTCHTKQFGPKGFGFGGAMSAERHSEVAEPAASVLSPIEATTASSDPVLEQAMVEWVAMVTGLELGGIGGATPRSALALKDGVALCELLNKIEPGSVARIPFAKPRTPFNELENLNEYLRACAALGVPDAVLFPPGALHQGANLDAVVRHLQYMFEVAGQIEGFSGKLGKWVLDKRMRMWLTDVSGVDVRVGELHPQLRDGFALCTLANAIEPGSIAKSLLQPATSKFGALETIAAFVQASRELGVAEHDLFASKELYEGTNMPAVTRTILALARVAAKRPSFRGPVLDLPPQSYEESILAHRESVLGANGGTPGLTPRKSVAPADAAHGSENHAPLGATPSSQQKVYPNGQQVRMDAIQVQMNYEQ